MTRQIFCKVLLVIVAIFGLLVLSNVLLAQGNSDWAFEHVRDVQERNTDRLMAMEGVEGTAIGLNENAQLAIKVFTAGPGVRGIPQELDGVPVQVVVTGKIYALADPTAKFPRPVPIGVSTGHPDITAGTIGCRVTDAQGNVYALSNNHVYADENQASIGDAVIQPGAYDGGTASTDTIGTLFDFEPIVFHPRANNTIDAAIALSDIDHLDNATPSDDGYGIPSSIPTNATLDLLVQKYGRTTGLTSGQVTGINATVRVGYSSGPARFVEQIIIEPGGFSAGGDSGSLIVTDDDNLNPVGLLFAGSSTITVANPIDLVLDRFGVTVDDEEAPLPSDAPPTVNITSPDDGAPVSGTITIEANASDDVSVMKVDFYIDGGLLGTDTEAPYSCSWDTITVSDGSHTITVTATDTIEQTTSAAITVTVDNINDHPVADAGPDQNVNTGSTVWLDGTGSYDPDGDPITYIWAFVSKPTGSAATLSGADTATPSFVADLDGTYEVELTVSDGELSSTDSVVVTAATVTEATTVSVAYIDYATEGGRDGEKHLLITVALEDDLGGLVDGASVSIDLFLGESLYTSGTGTTGTDGTIMFKVANAPSGTYTTQVTDVTAAGLAWNPDDPDNWSAPYPK